MAMRRVRQSEISWVLLLVLVAGVMGAAIVQWPSDFPITALVVPMIIANLLFSPRTLPWFVVTVLFVLVIAIAISSGKDAQTVDSRRIGGIVVCFAVGLVILLSSFRRSRLGVAGSRGESMLVDLRDRITKQSLIPELPADWYVEAVMRSAGGSSFAGDFFVASRSQDERHLEVAVVDVSGKGEQAGTRSLLLSGAFGGLLGALPAGQFLPAANEYLLRQDWKEGFATAVHLSIDLETGEFDIRSAGHPPAVQLHAGSGRWGVQDSEGPVLGLMSNAEFVGVKGSLQRGDALLLYTDGVVETPERDISLGIDKLVGQAERMLRDGFVGGANRLIDRMESMNDDRALLLLHRR
ncbi:MAG TPA: PP2C family protein-serine/threonine phosphatase [Nocardioidaceae bacterium]|nr:PP2C family protein-serine/threonine phosphatase [Nocardioidaceae bacterium]